MDGVAIATSQQQEPPESWRFWPIPDDGENPYSGKFLIDGWIIAIKKLDHLEFTHHFLFSSCAPQIRDFSLFEIARGGLVAMSFGQPGHKRLFHLTNPEPTILKALREAADQRKKVVMRGKTLFMQADDPEAQTAMFTGWDESNRCPCAYIDQVEDALPVWLERVWSEAKPILKSIFRF